MIKAITKSLAARREALTEQDEKGFTLIELLVVVIIIGILAAIAIPVYLGVQNNAKDASVQSDVANLKTAIVTTETGSGTLPTNLTGIMTVTAGTGSTAGSAVFTTAGKADGATFGSDTVNLTYAQTGSGATLGFCIQGTSVTSNTFFATDQTGVTSGTCPTS